MLTSDLFENKTPAAWRAGYERGLRYYRQGPDNPYPAGSEEAKDYADGYHNGELDSYDKYDTSTMNEGAVKELSQDLRSMSDEEFLARYKMTKAQARAGMKSGVAETLRLSNKKRLGTRHDRFKSLRVSEDQVPSEVTYRGDIDRTADIEVLGVDHSAGTFNITYNKKPYTVKTSLLSQEDFDHWQIADYEVEVINSNGKNLTDMIDWNNEGDAKTDRQIRMIDTIIAYLDTQRTSDIQYMAWKDMAASVDANELYNEITNFYKEDKQKIKQAALWLSKNIQDADARQAFAAFVQNIEATQNTSKPQKVSEYTMYVAFSYSREGNTEMTPGMKLPGIRLTDPDDEDEFAQKLDALFKKVEFKFDAFEKKIIELGETFGFGTPDLESGLGARSMYWDQTILTSEQMQTASITAKTILKFKDAINKYVQSFSSSLTKIGLPGITEYSTWEGVLSDKLTKQQEDYFTTPEGFTNIAKGKINVAKMINDNIQRQGMAEATGDEKFDKSMRQMTGKITPDDAAEMFPTQEFEPINLDPSYLPTMEKYKAKLFPLAYQYWTDGDNADELRALGWEPDYGDDYVMVVLSGIGHDGHIQYDKYDFDAEGEDVAEDSLNEFAPGNGGDDEAGDDPYKYPKPKRYNRSADYFEQFEADHFDREDFDDDTGVFKGYWGNTQIAYFKFDNPARTGGNNPGMGWYYEPQSSGRSDNTGAAPAVDRSEERKQQELSMINTFLKSGNRPNPDSQIGRLMKKHGMIEGQVNELSSDLLQKAAQVAKNKSDKAMDPKIHNALGGGYMNPLAKHYDTMSDKFSNRAVKIGQRDAVKTIASPATMRKIGMAEEQLTEQDLAEAVSTLELADFLFKGLEQKFPKIIERYGHEVVGNAVMDVAEENLDVSSFSEVDMLIDDIIEKLQNYNSNDSGLTESIVSRLYYHVVGTSAPELRKDFGMRHDRQGWFLSESSGRNRIMDAQRAFGSPKLVEYSVSDATGGAAQLGPDNVVSPVGSVPKSQRTNTKKRKSNTL